MNKTAKRIFSLVFMLVLVFSVTVPCYAAENAPVSSVTDGVKGFAEDLKYDLTNWFRNLFGSIKEALLGVKESIAYFFRMTSASVKNGLRSFAAKTADFAKTVFAATSDAVVEFGDGMKKLWNNAVASVKGAFHSSVNGTVRSFNAGADKVRSFFVSIGDTIKSVFNTAVAFLKDLYVRAMDVIRPIWPVFALAAALIVAGIILLIIRARKKFEMRLEAAMQMDDGEPAISEVDVSSEKRPSEYLADAKKRGVQDINAPVYVIDI